MIWLLRMAQQTGGTEDESIVALIILLLIFLLSFGFGIAWIVALWKIFAKVGQPGWAALIPIYNMVVFLKVVQRPLWWVVLFFIPVVQFIIPLILCFDLSRVFGKGGLFGLGLVLFNPIFTMILGFGSAEYVGRDGMAITSWESGTNDTTIRPLPAEPAESMNLGSPVEFVVLLMSTLLLCGMLGMLVNGLWQRSNQSAVALSVIDERERAIEPVTSESIESVFDARNQGMITFGSIVSKSVGPFDKDDWTFIGRRGQVVTIRGNAALADDTDPRIQLIDPNGQVLAEDDDSGGGSNALIERFELPADGEYTIRISTWSGGDYTLMLELE